MNEERKCSILIDDKTLVKFLILISKKKKMTPKNYILETIRKQIEKDKKILSNSDLIEAFSINLEEN